MAVAIVPWTEERESRLRELARDGYTMSQIARELGFITRSAVAGKLYRMGLRAKTKRQGVPDGELVKRVRRARAVRQRPLLPILVVPKDEPPSLRVPYLELNSSHCRWLCGETDDNCLPLSCGHETVRSTAWCAYHLVRVSEKYNGKQ